MVICVTDRKLCQEDFLHRIQKVAQAKPYAVMLREKDLDLPAYERLACQVKKVCDRYGVILILHRYSAVAIKMQHQHLHLSMPDLRVYRREASVIQLGASVHSVEEAREAEALGAAYVVAGHIYTTDCKRGIPPRGLFFLEEVCQAVDLPVLAIGGIGRNNIRQVLATGAQGCCVRSEAMTCSDPAAFIQALSVSSK
ncbi:hypothetical protein P22_0255 [Propionispora sp. 2/2-37]|uniref:thiamine phosphate synthase n=1 Tax=Propionispora sp. 2/2-37 TaxID=1677858 RepID=UPI0006BB88F4|nr:thiamine phosphate synthase [Propionispora sp. 2/2-37]CUH94189.1 hypothetical protein P22_0255 [Propionispora sp. 2/2-37]